MSAVLAIALGLLLGLFLIPIHGSPPGYALDSVLVFRLERALVIAGMLILPILVIAPLLAGVLPQKLSKDGIDWEDERANVIGTVEESKRRLDQLQIAVEKMIDLNDSA